MTSAPEAPGRRTGLGLGLLAYLLWGAMPLYFLSMRPAGAFEIVGWRVLFSLVFCALLLTAMRGWRAFAAVLRDRRVIRLSGLAGALIYVNWTVYVYASTTDRVVEAALGYFITPIVTVLLGVIVLHERLRVMQWVAVGMSVAAVAVLGLEAGSLPWISLALAASFGLYGLVKKGVGERADVVSGLTLETAWLSPLAVVQLILIGAGPGLAFGRAGTFPTLMLASAGVGTAVPLLLFAASAKRLPLTVVGFLQYLSPLLQFLLGVVVLHEAMPPARLAGFALVWVALLLLIGESVLHGGRSRRPSAETAAAAI